MGEGVGAVEHLGRCTNNVIDNTIIIGPSGNMRTIDKGNDYTRIRELQP